MTTKQEKYDDDAMGTKCLTELNEKHCICEYLCVHKMKLLCRIMCVRCVYLGNLVDRGFRISLKCSTFVWMDKNWSSGCAAPNVTYVWFIDHYYIICES